MGNPLIPTYKLLTSLQDETEWCGLTSIKSVELLAPYTPQTSKSVSVQMLQNCTTEHWHQFFQWSAVAVFLTSVRLLALRSSVLSRALFSRPSTLARWLCEQLRWRRVYTSLSPLVLISWLWSTDNLCSLLIDSRPARDEMEMRSHLFS